MSNSAVDFVATSSTLNFEHVYVVHFRREFGWNWSTSLRMPSGPRLTVILNLILPAVPAIEHSCYSKFLLSMIKSSAKPLESFLLVVSERSHIMAGLAVEATKRALYYYGPSILTQEYWEQFRRDENNRLDPGWLGRLQAAAGPHKDKTKDPHAAGRALDIILFAKNPQEKGYADRIVQIFLSLKQTMKFISVVYNNWEWNGAGAKFPHVDEAHKTHIHIEWSQTGVELADFAPALEDALYNEFAGGNVSFGDYATS